MRNYTNVALGGLLILVGFLFLGNSLDWFSFDLAFFKLAKWWPLLLIAAGLAAFIHPEKKVWNPLTLIFLIMAVPLALYSMVDRGVDNLEREIESSMDVDIFRDENESMNKDDSEYLLNGTATEQDFQIEERPAKSNELTLKGGAATFTLATTNSHAFQAVTRLKHAQNYQVSTDVADEIQHIEFKPQRSNSGDDDSFSVEGKEGKFGGNIDLKLNPNRPWDINLTVGAGEVDWNLTEFDIQNLVIETGAADVKMKLGEKQRKANVRIESGVAKVSLEVPKGVGCRIEMDGALNAKNFDGFTEVREGIWETPNFENADKTINVNLEAGLSAVKVKRY